MTNLKNLPEPRKAVLQNIKHPLTKEIIDKGLVLWFPGPRSFSGEDSCEFHVHGGIAVVEGILNALNSLPNFKLADPGEFTKRAFLNGKLDLTEVEGLADLLQAETEAQRKQAFLQSTGSLSKSYKKWKDLLKQSLANIEADIDFAETETLDYGLLEKVEQNIKNLCKELENHLNDGCKGELLRNGVKTVILGEPNAGKSSLLNLLCHRPASIVTPISGTTRDVIEVTLNIGGYPLVLADTAGLNINSQDVIEIEGMNRARDLYRKADLIILVVNIQSYSSVQERYVSFNDYLKNYISDLGLSDMNFRKNCIIILNKIDLDTRNLSANICDKNVVKLSCKSEEGIIDLIDILTKHLKVLCGEPTQEHPSMNQLRHRQELEKCYHNLQRFLKESERKESPDTVIMAEYIRKALRNLGKLIGEVTSEEILDIIFKDFCIGK
ncbi:hypothetical protein ABEB36_010861 [Hypothenemus hampei]